MCSHPLHPRKRPGWGNNRGCWFSEKAVCRILYTMYGIMTFLTHLILISEDVVVNVVFLRALGSKDEGLHEPPHWLAIVGQLAAHLLIKVEIAKITIGGFRYLNDHPVGQSLVRIHLPYLRVAVTEVQLGVNFNRDVLRNTHFQPALSSDGFLVGHTLLQLQHLERPVQIKMQNVKHSSTLVSLGLIKIFREVDC